MAQDALVERRTVRAKRILISPELLLAMLQNDLRAKSATDAEEQGIDPTRLLGHDKAETTKTYLRNRKAEVVAGPRLKGRVR